MAFMTFHSVGKFIIPTDEIHDFFGGQGSTCQAQRALALTQARASLEAKEAAEAGRRGSGHPRSGNFTRKIL